MVLIKKIHITPTSHMLCVRVCKPSYEWTMGGGTGHATRLTQGSNIKQQHCVIITSVSKYLGTFSLYHTQIGCFATLLIYQRRWSVVVSRYYDWDTQTVLTPPDRILCSRLLFLSIHKFEIQQQTRKIKSQDQNVTMIQTYLEKIKKTGGYKIWKDHYQ